jgi:putative CocE/NonD family hydrolase
MNHRIQAATLLCATLIASSVAASEIALSQPVPHEESMMGTVVRDIARKLKTEYREAEQATYFDNLFRLELIAGDYRKAEDALAAWQSAERTQHRSALANLKWLIYAHAKLLQQKTHTPFERAFADTAEQQLRQLSAKDAYGAIYSLETPLNVLDGALDRAVKSTSGKASLSQSDALALVRAYLAASAAHEYFPLLKAIAAADDDRRYMEQHNVAVKTPDGATVCALIVRPRNAARLPALLDFSIYADPVPKLDEARITAAHDYVGVMGFTRGKLCSPDSIVPVEHDGKDAAALIDWIAAQPWSDGRVGMYGGSYDGFTQWATLKHKPAALKAIMPLVTFSPGTDFPMEGNISLDQAYTWPFYTTTNKTVNDALYNDDAHWNRLFRGWYTSGRAYRDLAKIDGRQNPFFERWLDHPSFDAYWQSTIPVGEEFARIDIPVLTVTGYYDAGQIGALSYFIQHYRYRPNAEHYLVIGPYDHHSTQIGTIGPLGNSILQILRGYTLDPVAQFDTYALRYAWFDYVFKGAPKPALLQNRVNYEVMGANVWKHAPSLAAMAAKTRRFYLSPTKTEGDYKLTDRATGQSSILQTVNFSDRSDVDRFAPSGKLVEQDADDYPIVDTAPDLANALVFESNAFQKPPEISGLFSGRLDFVTNKRDFDFDVTLFERTTKGEYIQLSYVWKRASFVMDRSHRQLLTPGARTELDFTAGRLTSRQFQPGSRLVIVLSIIKQPADQINYGSGKPVSDETIADAGPPLQIRWFGDSYISVPFGR